MKDKWKEPEYSRQHSNISLHSPLFPPLRSGHQNVYYGMTTHTSQEEVSVTRAVKGGMSGVYPELVDFLAVPR